MQILTRILRNTDEIISLMKSVVFFDPRRFRGHVPAHRFGDHIVYNLERLRIANCRIVCGCEQRCPNLINYFLKHISVGITLADRVSGYRKVSYSGKLRSAPDSIQDNDLVSERLGGPMLQHGMPNPSDSSGIELKEHAIYR